jgi:bifunctional lysine-specific demethylase and histidyl-hydroxylase NO66
LTGSTIEGDSEALSRCVGDPARFLAEHWGRRAHLWHGSSLSQLLSLDDVDTILSSMALRAPAFRVVKDGVTVDAASCTRRARIGSRTVTDLIDPGRVYDHFAGGATIVLQGLHRYWSPVGDLCRQLEAELTHPFQANAYITPPVAQGLGVHEDRHDVFAVQTHGSKQWVVHGPPELDVELRPDDCLYVPRGVRHAARTVASLSIHLTLGLRAVTWGDVMARILNEAATQSWMEEPLPAGFARRPEELEPVAAERLGRLTGALGSCDASAALTDTARSFWTSRAPVLTGQLQAVMAAGAVHDGTLVRRRPQAVCILARSGDALEVSLADRTLRMPAAVEPALRRLAGLDELKAADLGDLLDEAGRVTLVRRLVREGLLTVVHG